MKLIITIPAYNEEDSIGDVIKDIPRKIKGINKVKVLVIDDGSGDNTRNIAKKAGADYVIANIYNKGLAFTFKRGLEEALKLGADIIVNTDADFQYNQKEIPKLVQPILKKEAEMVIGDRGVKNLSHMPLIKKIGNLSMTFFLKRALRANISDASSGFRAFSKECAMRLNIHSNYTYTHETIIQATFQKMRIENIPIEFRKREIGSSKLIQGSWSHVKRCAGTVVRIYLMYSPFRTFLKIGLPIFIIGIFLWLRYLSFYLKGQGGGHLQSMLLGVTLVILGIQVIIMGFLADIIDANRKRQEEILYKIKKEQYEQSSFTCKDEQSSFVKKRKKRK